MVKHDKLVIYLEATPSLPSWVLLDSDNKVQEIFYRSPAEKLTEHAATREVIVLVPAEDVLLTTVKLPKMNRSRLLQALPYALEEQLIAEVTTLHFALLDVTPENNLSVAVVSKEKMQNWIALLKSWYVQAECLLPVCLTLPFEETCWSVLVTDLSIARVGSYQGFACDTSNLKVFLSTALSSISAPHSIQIFNCTEYSCPLLELSLPIKEDFIQVEQMLTMFATSAVKINGNNLLQGEFAIKKSRFSQVRKMWKLATSLAMAWIMLLILYPIISFLILTHRLNQIEGEIKRIYQQQFPQANSVIAPKFRMQEKLQTFSTDDGKIRFLVLLAKIGKGMTQSTGLNLKRLDFQNNQLTLELVATTSEDFAALTSSLSQQGLNVKQQSANLNGARINATLLVE